MENSVPTYFVHKTHSRIDYFFMNVGYCHLVEECGIGGAVMSDHNPLFENLFKQWRTINGMETKYKLTEE